MTFAIGLKKHHYLDIRKWQITNFESVVNSGIVAFWDMTQCRLLRMHQFQDKLSTKRHIPEGSTLLFVS